MNEHLDDERRLSRTEVEARLASFSAADWARAESIARLLCWGLSGWSAEDLLQEAMCSLLSEARVWKAKLHPLVVLKTVMRSIASNARRHGASSPIDEAVVVDPPDAREDDATPVAYSVTSTTPEDDLSGKQELKAIDAMIAGNEELELVAMSWADNLRGEKAREALGWDAQKYDAARNRLLRRLRALESDRRPE